MKNNVWIQIVDFTCRMWPVKKDELTRETRLQYDLGIRGDDADEFMFEFTKQFNLDINSIDLSDYFDGNEGDFITPLMRFFKRIPPQNTH